MEFQTKFAATITVALIIVTVVFGVVSCNQFSKTEKTNAYYLKIYLKNAINYQQKSITK